MNIFDYIQFALFIGLLILTTPILGKFMANVFQGENTWLHKPLGWLERLAYRVGGVDEKKDMGWKEYAFALMAFNLLGILFLFVIQMVQGNLPFNPQNMPNVSWHSALNTAVSFVTNTNWQGYAGEVTMSYFTQMMTLAVQNFLSAAVGIAVAMIDLETGKIIREFSSIQEAARWLVDSGVAKNTNCASSISSVCLRKPCTTGYGFRKKAYGYDWRFSEDI